MMSVATRPRRKPQSKQPPLKKRDEGNGEAAAEFAAQVARARRIHLESRNVEVGQVDPSPFQPRQTFPEEEIRGLAESMVRQGQLVPILCREVAGGRLELIAGERRLRAAKLAGLGTLRAEVGDFTDAEVCEHIVAEAKQRQDLNPIEEAHAFRQAIAAGVAAGPTELARQLGLSQGQVSNRLRLLELPSSVQQQVISQEIPATHAREFARLKDHPQLLEKVVGEFCEEAKYGEIGTVEQLHDELATLVARFTEQLDGEDYDSKMNRRIPRFTPTEAEREQLGVVAVEDFEGYGKKRKPVVREFATNTKLWAKLQAAHAKRWLAENPAGKKGGGAKPKAESGKPKKLTPAQEAAKEKEQARQFAKRLSEWFFDWTQYLIARQIPETSDDQAARVLLFLAAHHNHSLAADAVEDSLAALEDAKRKKKDRWGRGADIAAELAGLSSLDVTAVVSGTLARCFWGGEDGPRPGYLDEEVAAIAQIVGVFWEDAWLEEQAGPLSEAYWNLHRIDQLDAMAEELGRGDYAELKTQVAAAKTKVDRVTAFLSWKPAEDATLAGLPLPKELKALAAKPKAESGKRRKPR